METVKIQSSQIQEVAYDTESSKLYVKFVRSGWYSYKGVPVELYIGLTQAPSAGRYFGQHIKTKFAYQKHLEKQPW